MRGNFLFLNVFFVLISGKRGEGGKVSGRSFWSTDLVRYYTTAKGRATLLFFLVALVVRSNDMITTVKE